MTADILDLTAKLRDALERSAPASLIDPRTVPCRFSRLRKMGQSPLHYWQAVQDDSDDTIAMRFGRGVHALVLGTPVVRWDGKTRQGKRWEAFEAEHADKEILSAKEWDRAHGILDALRSHHLAAELIFGEDVVREEAIEWELMGKACTSRPDARLGTAINADLKTTRCAAPRRFSRDAMYRCYHAQFSFYDRAIRERFGSSPSESLCIAVEPVKPFAITVLSLTASDLTEGEKMWRLWFEQLLQCEAAARDASRRWWPAYSDVVVPMDIAVDDDPGLIIGGEEFSFDSD